MIEVTVTGDKEIIARLDRMPDSIRESMAKEMQRWGFRLQRNVQKDKLSGQVLKVRTGVLRSSINLKVDDAPDRITATVGTKVAYARVHEFGFRGKQSVRAHLRKVTRLFGKPVTATLNIKAHTRNVKFPERSFLRSALKELEPDFKKGMKESLRRLIEDAISG
ncbi:MAG: HK97 gp10 family phage protein [Alphaproteobacteria bacterium]